MPEKRPSYKPRSKAVPSRCDSEERGLISAALTCGAIFFRRCATGWAANARTNVGPGSPAVTCITQGRPGMNWSSQFGIARLNGFLILAPAFTLFA